MSTTKNHIAIRNKTSSTLWRKALGLCIFDISNSDVCKIQWWFLLKKKTSSTPWKKALGRGAWQSWSKRPKGTHWLSWWRFWRNDHEHQREIMIILIITMIQHNENKNFYRSSSERTSGTGIAWGLNIMNSSSAWQTPEYILIYFGLSRIDQLVCLIKLNTKYWYFLELV